MPEHEPKTLIEIAREAFLLARRALAHDDAREGASSGNPGAIKRAVIRGLIAAANDYTDAVLGAADPMAAAQAEAAWLRRHTRDTHCHDQAHKLIVKATQAAVKA